MKKRTLNEYRQVKDFGYSPPKKGQRFEIPKFDPMTGELNPYYKEINSYNEYNSSTWKIEPEKNLCVLFPSYLNHYVEPNLNKKERISISFNYV